MPLDMLFKFQPKRYKNKDFIDASDSHGIQARPTDSTEQVSVLR